MDPHRRERLIVKVVQAQAGDRAALEWVLVEIQDELLGYLSRLTGCQAAAEDVLQETFILICRQVRWLREPRFFRTWAYRIATREAWRQMRLSREHETLTDGHAQVEPPPDAETNAEIFERVDALPPNCRAALLLHYRSGLSLAAVAAALDVPLGTVKSRLNYALALLRKEPHAAP